MLPVSCLKTLAHIIDDPSFNLTLNLLVYVSILVAFPAPKVDTDNNSLPSGLSFNRLANCSIINVLWVALSIRTLALTVTDWSRF